MRKGLGFVVVFVAACGGSGGSDLFTGEGNGGTNETQSSGATPGASTTPSATSTGTGAPPPCAATKWYRDDDGDGFGGTTTQTQCDSPGKGWVTKPGDCEDGNADVFPGQTKYFATAYSKSGNVKSFDYDCSGKEDQQPPPRKAATTCTLGSGIAACIGDGYVPVVRNAGAGVDPLCGSTQYQTCRLKPNGPAACEASITQAESPTSCR